MMTMIVMITMIVALKSYLAPLKTGVTRPTLQLITYYYSISHMANSLYKSNIKYCSCTLLLLQLLLHTAPAHCSCCCQAVESLGHWVLQLEGQ